MQGYTNKNSIERYMLTDIDASFNAQIDEWIEVAENIIKGFTGRNFIADMVVSIRVYDGDGTHTLLIDDCVELTKIELGDPNLTKEELDSDDYHIYPYNETPKTKVYYDGIFSGIRAGVDVTAKWGYSINCPADINLATTILVSLMFEEAHQSEGETESESIGNYSITYRKTEANKSKLDRAINILNRYKKFQIG